MRSSNRNGARFYNLVAFIPDEIDCSVEQNMKNNVKFDQLFRAVHYLIVKQEKLRCNLIAPLS